MDVRYYKKIYLQPAFVICVAVFALAGGSMSVAINSFGMYLKKEPLPLKNPLDLLDKNGLKPYLVDPESKLKIENEQVLKELGTEDYIMWVLEDPRLPLDSPVRTFVLFITYYEQPDRVPHVPEECYTGGGYQRLATDSVTFEVEGPNFHRSIPGKYLVFGSAKREIWRSGGKFPVLYFFRVNGEYAGSRDEARMILNKNLFRKQSYFCKVELAFNRGLAMPEKEQALNAGENVLSVILPILEKDHWPDWER